MESTNEALTVQVSSACADALTQLGGFELTERGRVRVKGKGTMLTYWVIKSRHCQYVVNIQEARAITQANIWHTPARNDSSIDLNAHGTLLHKDFYEKH